ncbi:MAG: AraC family transcriptional regulator [Lachnospiraceae bacterium]|nr:AraC family transcriptional regulator [Lachnospiraceae bacterium]
MRDSLVIDISQTSLHITSTNSIFLCCHFKWNLCKQYRFTVSPVTQKYYREFAKIRTQIYNSPSADWSVNQLADTLCLSCSHFQHLYKHFFACSCQHDIILARVALAKFYLTTTNMSIYQLSLFCGYETDLHFMRQFKKYVGVTPTEFRMQVHS